MCFGEVLILFRWLFSNVSVMCSTCFGDILVMFLWCPGDFLFMFVLVMCLWCFGNDLFISFYVLVILFGITLRYCLYVFMLNIQHLLGVSFVSGCDRGRCLCWICFWTPWRTIIVFELLYWLVSSILNMGPFSKTRFFLHKAILDPLQTPDFKYAAIVSEDMRKSRPVFCIHLHLC